MRSVQNKSFVTSGTSALIVPNQQTQLSLSLRVQKQKKPRKKCKDNNSPRNTKTQRKTVPGQKKRRGRPPKVKKQQDNTQDIKDISPPRLARKANHIKSSTIRANPFKVQKGYSLLQLDNETRQYLQHQLMSFESQKEIEWIFNLQDQFLQNQQQIPIRVQAEEQRKLKQMNARQRSYFYKKKERLNQLRYEILNPKNLTELIKIQQGLVIIDLQADVNPIGMEIDFFTIQTIFKAKSYEELSSIKYLMLENQDPFCVQAAKFTIRTAQRDIALSQDPKGCSKYRSFLTKKIWQYFIKDKLNLGYRNQRIKWIEGTELFTPQDKKEYLLLNRLPSYDLGQLQLQRLLEHKDFRDFYRQYISSNKLRKKMIEANEMQKQKYQREIEWIKCLQLDLEEKIIKMFLIEAQPRTMAIIDRYDNESRTILRNYF